MGVSLEQYRQSVGCFYTVQCKINMKIDKLAYFSCRWLIQLYLYNYNNMLLMLSGDVESNPGPITTTLASGKVAITGTVHQGSPQFLITESGASTCMTNSLVALAYSQILPTSQWNSAAIDSILRLGKLLYDEIYPNRRNKDSSPYLEVIDLQITQFTIGNKHFFSNPCFSTVGFLANTASSSATDVEFHSMELVFDDAFKISSQSILIVKDYGMGLFTIDNQYYLFDPHSRNDQGYSDPDGHAVLLIFKTMYDLCNHIRHLTSTLTQEPLESVLQEIETLQQSMNPRNRNTATVNESMKQKHCKSQ